MLRLICRGWIWSWVSVGATQTSGYLSDDDLPSDDAERRVGSPSDDVLYLSFDVGRIFCTCRRCFVPVVFVVLYLSLEYQRAGSPWDDAERRVPRTPKRLQNGSREIDTQSDSAINNSDRLIPM